MQSFTILMNSQIYILSERIFWLGIGLFFILAIIKSIIKSNKKKYSTTNNCLEELADKAVQKNHSNKSE